VARAPGLPAHLALRRLCRAAGCGHRALGVRFGLDWAATNGRSSDALAAKQVQLKALDLQTAPLRGLDKRVEESRAQMQAFYAKRIPPNYSLDRPASASWR
jgi:hypothetical protein